MVTIGHYFSVVLNSEIYMQLTAHGIYVTPDTFGVHWSSVALIADIYGAHLLTSDAH